MKTIGEYIVDVALADYNAGYGEVGGDNQGPWIMQIMRGWLGAWCAGWVCDVIERAFALWILDGEGLSRHKAWTPTYTRSARNLYNQFKAAGKLVEIPQPGDIVFMSRKGAPWMGHVAIITQGPYIPLSASQKSIYTIEGNLGKYPAKLKKVYYPDYAKVPRLLGYGRMG
jgi:hypothetical protein